MAWEIQELDWSRLQPPDKPKGSWFWALAIAVGLVLMWVGIANAHSADRPELNDWLMAQRNQIDGVCCDGNDVVQLSDNQWRIQGDHYEVNWRGTWEEIPNDRLTKDAGNKLPTALLWVYRQHVQCFKPAFLW
jgi:hypothetical protein